MQTEYLVGRESISGSPIELSHADFQSLLKTPLFADSAVNERQFAHRSLRDFLAACCLIRWNLEETQLSSFLTTSNGLSSIPPQMLDVATWLVALAPADFSCLVTSDPFNLTKNRLALDRPELASALVPLLLARATEIDRVLAWHDKFEGLGHAELAAQLRVMLGIDDPDQIQLMWKYRPTPLWATIGHHFDGMEIESEGARRLRKSWETARETNVEPKTQGMTPAEYTAVIERLILATRDRPTDFWRLARWLDVDLDAGYYRNSSSPDLLQLGCIKLLDEATVEVVLHLALEYLRHADEAVPMDLQPHIVDYPLIAAYQAPYTLEKHRAESLDEAIDIPWVSLPLRIGISRSLCSRRRRRRQRSSRALVPANSQSRR